MAYSRITGYPRKEEIDSLLSSELFALAEIWREKKAELEGSGEYKEFIKKLQREWAIETGIIERLYIWDRGVTEILIEQGIDSSVIAHRGGMNRTEADGVKYIIDDQMSIIEGLFGYVKGEELFSEYFIRSVHAQFTQHQDSTDALTPDGKIIKVQLAKGEYKQHPNNPKRPDGETHFYCPPELVKDEMEFLVNEYIKQEKSKAPEILSAWVHHRFTQIHPFQDGNGRVARTLASLVFLKAGLFPLVIRDKDRKDYIYALEQADKGDLTGLVSLFSKRQKESILAALGIQQQVLQSKHAEHIISTAISALKTKYTREKDKFDGVITLASELHRKIFERLQKISQQIDSEINTLTPPSISEKFHTTCREATNGTPNDHYFFRQIVKIANEFNYYANLDKYKSWVRINIWTDKNFEIVFSIHGYGHINSGIMAISAFTSQRVQDEDEYTEVINTTPACTDLFQFNYAELRESIEKRFEEWIESSIAISLAEWNKSINA
jgi:Fic family protein